jgi:protein ImuB
VADLSPAAAQCQITPGTPLADALRRCPEAALVPRDPNQEQRAWQAICGTLYTVTPLLEPQAEHWQVILDITGCSRQYRGEVRLGATLHALLQRAAGLQAHIGMASTRLAATLAAQQATEHPLVIPPGEESAFLSSFPLRALGLPPALLEQLTFLGIQTIGEFVTLPRAAVAARFGQAAAAAHAAATGHDDQPVAPYAPPKVLTRELEVDTLTSLDRLLFVTKHLLDGLEEDLRQAFLAPRCLTLTVTFENGSHKALPLRLATAGGTAHYWLSLLRPALEQLASEYPIVRLAAQASELGVEVAQAQPLFDAAWAKAQALHTIAMRAHAVAPEAPVGFMEVQDKRLPEAVAVLHPWDKDPPPQDAACLPPETVVWQEPGLRVAKRPLPARVTTQGDRIVRVRWAGRTLYVAESVGPWRLAQSWWQQEAQRDYYRVVGNDATVLLLFYDCTTDRWYVQGLWW